MMNSKVIISGIIVGLLAACNGYVPRGFLPTPSLSESWVKPSVSKRDTIIALLECGFSAPDIRNDYPMTPDEIAWASYCMENDGFYYPENRVSWRLRCKKYSDEIRGYVDSGLSACEGDAIAPARSVDRRINSKFCKDRPGLVVCQ
jgi:hypothetical protein